MSDFDDITLLIPSHNRHGYLSRILDYYHNLPISIVIVDSSATEYSVNYRNVRWRYIHCPGKSFPEKLSETIRQIGTRFLVMCADDDFLIPAGILQCRDYLLAHPDFASAQGNSISYKKQRNYSKLIEFNRMYDSNVVELFDTDPLRRIEHLFNPYRAIFSAVHRTENLEIAYQDIDPGIQNLFLNEYITAIVPVAIGKHVELPLFYQLREHAVDSGDKTTDNLEVIFGNSRYDKEIEAYLNYLADRVQKITQRDFGYCRGTLEKILRKFSSDENIRKNSAGKEKFDKKAGKLIASIPIIGNKIVMTRRVRNQRAQIADIVKTTTDIQELDKLKSLIIEYAPNIE